MSTDIKPITAEEFMQMHFDVPVELVRGEIVFPYGEDGMTRPDQAHGGICGLIAYLLTECARRNGTGRVTTNDAGILTEHNPDTLRGADVAYFRMERLPAGKLPRGRTDIVPQLCVEVLLPSNTYPEISNKIEEYLACGVEEVWIVDPESRTVDLFRSDAPQRRFGPEEQITTSVLPEFSCSVADFFEGIE